MSRPLVSDDLWAVVEPLLPVEPPKPKGGRPRCDDRAALAGIVLVARALACLGGCGPRELGCSGMTCWRRLRDWHGAGVWAALHRVLLGRLADAGQLDWSRASLDGAFVAAGKGGAGTGPNPTDRGPRRAQSAIVWSTAGARPSGSA